MVVDLKFLNNAETAAEGCISRMNVTNVSSFFLRKFSFFPEFYTSA